MQCMTQDDLLSMLTCPATIFDTRQFVVLNRTQPAGRLVFTVTNEGGKEIVLYVEPVPRVQDLTKIATFAQLIKSSSLRMLISQNKMSVLSIAPDGRYVQPMARPEFFPIREGDIYLSGKSLPGTTITLIGTTQNSVADANGYFFLHIGIAKKPDIEVNVSLTGFRATAFKVLVDDSNLGTLNKPDLLGMAVSSTSLSGRTVPGATLTLIIGETTFSTLSDKHGLFVLICDALTSDLAQLRISAIGYSTQQFEYEPQKRRAILRLNSMDYLTNLVDGYTEPEALLRIQVDGQPEVTAYADENGLFSQQVLPIKGKVNVEALHKDFFNRIQEITPKLAIFEYVAVDTSYSTHTAIVVRLNIPRDSEQVDVTLVMPDGTVQTSTTFEKEYTDVVFAGLDLSGQIGEASIKLESQFFTSVVKKFPIVETNVLAEPHLLSFTEGKMSVQGIVGASAGTVKLRTPAGKFYGTEIQTQGKFVFILDEPIIIGQYEFEFEVAHYPKAFFKFGPNPKPLEEVK